jgi:hypothetical protein
MTEDHEGLQMSKQRPLPPEVPPELDPEWREVERQLDEYITHWGNAVDKMLEAKGYTARDHIVCRTRKLTAPRPSPARM